MYEENLDYDHSYILEVPFPFCMLETGEFLVGHILKCTFCENRLQAYINMAKVQKDIVTEAVCMFCGNESLVLDTYNLKPLED